MEHLFYFYVLIKQLCLSQDERMLSYYIVGKFAVD